MLGTIRIPVIALAQVFRATTRTMGTSEKILSQDSYVETTQDNGVRTITLNHPRSRNSLSMEMMEILLQNITKDQDNQDLRSIVLTATPGKVFSAGHNLKELTTKNGREHHLNVFRLCQKLMMSIMQSPVPVIAAVDGLAAAAGCQLVAGCDIAICTENSSFSTPGANFGIFCSTPGIPLSRNVPKKMVAHMLFTGLPISAQEALRAGLVSKVVPADALGKEVGQITDAINAKSRSVVRLGKRFFYEQLELDISSAYDFGTEVMVGNLELKDAQEGVKSFSEKRKPKWTHSYEKELKN